jgi:hypothetical protein
VLRGYRSALSVTPASVVPGILENLENWGFPAQRLDHGLVSHLMARKQQRLRNLVAIRDGWTLLSANNKDLTGIEYPPGLLSFVLEH